MQAGIIALLNFEKRGNYEEEGNRSQSYKDDQRNFTRLIIQRTNESEYKSKEIAFYILIQKIFKII